MRKKNMAWFKPWKIMKKLMKKSWNTMKNRGKPWKTMENRGKPWKTMEDDGTND